MLASPRRCHWASDSIQLREGLTELMHRDLSLARLACVWACTRVGAGRQRSGARSWVEQELGYCEMALTYITHRTGDGEALARAEPRPDYLG